MKRILFFILLLLPFVSFSQVKVGANGAIHPTGNYPSALQREVQGYSLSVQSLVDRNAIASNMRDTGMIILVRNDSSLYTLVGGITNSDWVEYPMGGSSGGGGTVTSVATNTGSGITGGTITTTGTIAADTTSVLSTKAHVTDVLQGYVPITRTINGTALSSNITLTLASSQFANQGTTTTVLHGNASGNPSWAQIAIADLSATGTPSSSTYLRGDNTWATVSAGGTTAKQTVTAASDGQVAFTFSSLPASTNDYDIYVDGVYVAPSFFSVATNTITFTAGIKIGALVEFAQKK